MEKSKLEAFKKLINSDNHDDFRLGASLIDKEFDAEELLMVKDGAKQLYLQLVLLNIHFEENEGDNNKTFKK